MESLVDAVLSGAFSDSRCALADHDLAVLKEARCFPEPAPELEDSPAEIARRAAVVALVKSGRINEARALVGLPALSEVKHVA